GVKKKLCGIELIWPPTRASLSARGGLQPLVLPLLLEGEELLVVVFLSLVNPGLHLDHTTGLHLGRTHELCRDLLPVRLRELCRCFFKACAYGVNVFEWSVDEIRFAECDCTSEFACSVDLKDLVARMEKLERETHELEAKNRDLENRVDRMAHVGRQEEEAQVERMSERAREVTGYGAHQKRMGEEETVYDSRSGKVPRGNYAESVHDMGGRGNGHRDFRQNESHTRGSYQHNRAYGMPPPRLGQPAPTAPAKDKQDLRLAIGVFRGQYATATVGEQIALIAQTVPRSFIPSDARRDDYRFGLLVMTFRSYNDRDAFTQEWSAHYKNSLLEWEGLKLRGIGEDF
ncbi:hypothetical protein F5877DRAFT_73431, partial [Lentinula edodes]